MDLGSLLLLQNGISRLSNRFEAIVQDAPESIRNSGAALPGTTGLKHVMTIVPLAGAGLVAAALFLTNPSPPGIVSVQKGASSGLTCHYMTVSLLPGGNLSAKSEAFKGAADLS